MLGETYMNVVLVNPRAQKSHRRLPLSVLFVARNLPESVSWQIVDANINAKAKEEAEAIVARDPANTVVMVTVMPGPQLAWATPWCRALKTRWPEVTVVWGGYFPSVYPEVVCQDAGVDYAVLNQGEDTAVELLAALASGTDPAGISGLAVWRGGRLISGAPRPWTRSSRYPMPPYHRLPMEDYAAKTFLGNRTFNHHSSVGCPYTCNFCAVTTVANGSWIPDRARDVIETVTLLREKYGADALEVHDPNYFAAERRCFEVARGITPLSVRWWGEGRIDTMLAWSHRTWAALARSGLRMVFYGAESGDQGALEAMDKGGLQVEHTEELNRRARHYGIIPEFSFVMGNPADPEGDIAATLALIRRLKADNPDCEIILYMYTPVPLPGMYDEATAQGFAFPKTLDEWLSSAWSGYEERRNPVTPWLTPAIVRGVYDFESVLHAWRPSVSDRNLSAWQRGILRILAAPRYRLGWYNRPYELKALQRLWRYRRPEEMGF